jgi:hypothetical protein
MNFTKLPERQFTVAGLYHGQLVSSSWILEIQQVGVGGGDRGA